jgi:S1-C subfamily serine protease
MKKHLFTFSKFALYGVSVALTLMVMVATVLIATTYGPQVHSYFLRNKVGPKVVLLIKYRHDLKTNAYIRSSMGTGFHVQAPSGKIYILSNRHVCNINDGDTINVKDGGIDTKSIEYTRKIIKVSQTQDLCLVESVYDKGLGIASDAGIGEFMSVVGHPTGYDLTVTKGEIVGAETLNFYEKIKDGDESKCNFKNQKVEAIPMIDKNDKITLVKTCHTKNIGLITTAQVKSGNSGSPAVNYFGQLVGVIFAISSDDWWGRIIPLNAVKDFLKGY